MMLSGRLNFVKLSRNICNSVASDANKSTNLLNSAQSAFASRLGINQIPPSKILTALNHPKLKKNQSSLEEFEHFISIGNEAFTYFTKEYIKTRFPVLEYKFAKIGWKTFLADQNVLNLAKLLGIDAACGTDLILRNRQKSEKDSKLPKVMKIRKIDTSEELNVQEIQLECFKALLGLIAIETGPLGLRNFLDSRYFNNSHFNPEDLIRPVYPIPDLALIHPNLAFRLHQESGRFSSNSMFIVGVYECEESGDCLGEGHGPSIALAQQRAATVALRKLDLKEVPVINRSSDKATSMKSIEELGQLLYH